jgi:hypothetical protein
MILTTHAVVGAALATFLPSHSAAAFAVGFARGGADSKNPHLFNRILGQHLFDDPHSVETRRQKAKRYIDVILA